MDGSCVLVVDDDAGYRNALERALVLEGCRVRTVGRGEEAILLCEGALEPAAAVVDLLMPGVGGLEVIRRLRQRTPPVPVVAISGAARRGAGNLLRRAAALGAQETLEKPFEPEDLVAAVKRLLEGP